MRYIITMTNIGQHISDPMTLYGWNGTYWELIAQVSKADLLSGYEFEDPIASEMFRLMSNSGGCPASYIEFTCNS